MYKCECGREFEKPSSFNGHKSHCKAHMIATNKVDAWQQAEEARHKTLQNTMLALGAKNKQTKLTTWLSEKHTCQRCGKIMTEKYGSGQFCSRSCANTRDYSKETANKISKSIKQLYDTGEIISHFAIEADEVRATYLKSPNKCIICGKDLPYEKRNNKTCSKACLSISATNNGKHSAIVQADTRRSKNEIAFYELCKEYFKDVRHNEAIFNGWDADVIIEDIKYAILWNGPWHYKQISKKQSLSQVQNRDKIKEQEIKKAGYTLYIIKDMGKYNEAFVKEQFGIFIQNIKDLWPNG